MAYLGTAATGRHRVYRYYACRTRNLRGTTCCDAPRIDADTFDDHVVAALCDFYRTRTSLIAEAISAAQDAMREARHTAEAELRAVGIVIAQKEAAIDRHFADYEASTIEKNVLKSRIEQLERQLHDLYRHRDQLRQRLDDASQYPAHIDVEAVSDSIAQIIAGGTTAARRTLCEATLHELRLDINARTATPVLRANTAPAGALLAEDLVSGGTTRGGE